MPAVDHKLAVTSKIISNYRKLVKKAVESMTIDNLCDHLDLNDGDELRNIVLEMESRAISPRS